MPKIPKAIGARADLYYTTREERYALQKKVDELKKFESELADSIIQDLPKSQAGGIAGKVCRVTIKSTVIPRVEDWDKFHAHIIKNAKKGGFALLQKRVSDTAVKEIWESGKQVPGVTTFTTIGLSVNKL